MKTARVIGDLDAPGSGNSLNGFGCGRLRRARAYTALPKFPSWRKMLFSHPVPARNPMSPEARLAEKLAELKLLLPPAAEPKGVYKPLVIVGNLAYTSGHLPVKPDGTLITGRVGADLDVQGRLSGGPARGIGNSRDLAKTVRVAR